MEQKKPVFYTPSGKCPPVALIFALIATFIAAPLLGGIYALAIFYCPFIYINFLLTFGFAYALVWCLGLALRTGKLRNTKAAGKIGILAGLLGLYASWVVWIFALSEFKFLAILPKDVLQIISSLTEEGVWGILGFTPTGIFLYLIWLIEAGMIIFLAWIGTMTKVSAIFCEHCDRWVGNEEVDIRRLDYGENEEHFTKIMEGVVTGEVLGLNSLQTAPEGSAAYLEAETSGCLTCQALNFLSLRNVLLEMDSDGKTEKKEEEFLSRMFLTPDEFEGLRNHRTQTPGQTPAPRPTEHSS